MVATQFEHTSARKAFPCFDEPKYRATFDVRLAQTAPYVAISNTAVKKETQPE